MSIVVVATLTPKPDAVDAVREAQLEGRVRTTEEGLALVEVEPGSSSGDAVAVAGLVWIRLLRSILLGKYGSIVLFVLELYLGVKDEGGFRREEANMIVTGGGRSKSYAA